MFLVWHSEWVNTRFTRFPRLVEKIYQLSGVKREEAGTCYPPSSAYTSSQTSTITQCRCDWPERQSKPRPPRQHGQVYPLDFQPGIAATSSEFDLAISRQYGERFSPAPSPKGIRTCVFKNHRNLRTLTGMTYF